MKGRYDTTFLESEIILALIAGDREEAVRLLGEMNRSERSLFQEACRQAGILVQDIHEVPHA